MSGTGIERRRHERFDLMAQVHVKHGTVDFVLELVNISESGAMLELGSLKAPPWVRAGKDVSITLFDEETLEDIVIAASIVRALDNAFAVCFNNVTDELREAILRVIRNAVAEAQRASAEARRIAAGAPPRPDALPANRLPAGGARVPKDVRADDKKPVVPPPLPKES